MLTKSPKTKDKVIYIHRDGQWKCAEEELSLGEFGHVHYQLSQTANNPNLTLVTSHGHLGLPPPQSAPTLPSVDSQAMASFNALMAQMAADIEEDEVLYFEDNAEDPIDLGNWPVQLQVTFNYE